MSPVFFAVTQEPHCSSSSSKAREPGLTLPTPSLAPRPQQPLCWQSKSSRASIRDLQLCLRLHHWPRALILSSSCPNIRLSSQEGFRFIQLLSNSLGFFLPLSPNRRGDFIGEGKLKEGTTKGGRTIRGGTRASSCPLSRP